MEQFVKLKKLIKKTPLGHIYLWLKEYVKYGHKSRREAFTQIYKQNVWGGEIRRIIRGKALIKTNMLSRILK